MDNINGHVMNLANSIIGVSILAMPYCFKQCGIVLSIVMLLISSIISRLTCHFLLKSAIMSRRRTFEFLAFHIFGSMGKLAIEIGMIGFLLGTCIAFFVVMGDLAPEIISEMTGAMMTSTMRTSILMALALFCVLPLGLLRNVDSLNIVSQATICFYCCLVLKVIFEATPHLFRGDWSENVNFWRPEGILQCLPIFSMALFCQTQLFEIYQALQNATLDKMNNVVRVAVNICTCVYILVGTFGYIAFSNKTFSGNILLSFSPSFMTDVMKMGFVLSVAFSFPLVIFPCRASLYSLLYKEGYSLHEGVSNYIPEGKFKALTMIIVFISLIVGILIPNIELVLGLVGSTIGVMICVLFPVTCFICISPKNTNERLLAQFMLMIGIFFMVLGTYKNVHSLDNMESNVVTITSLRIFNPPQSKDIPDKPIQISNELFSTIKAKTKPELIMKIPEESKEVRHEPPQPIEPADDSDKSKAKKGDIKLAKINENSKFISPEIGITTPPTLKKVSELKSVNESIKNEEVDIEAIKKEDKEVELQQNEQGKEEDKNHQVLIDTIQKQHEVQKEIVEQQKKLIEVIQNQQKHNEHEDVHKVNVEKMKAVKEIESIALKAIEKISAHDNEKLVDELKKDIKQVENAEIDHVDAFSNKEKDNEPLEVAHNTEIVKMKLQPQIKSDIENDIYKQQNLDQLENKQQFKNINNQNYANNPETLNKKYFPKPSENQSQQNNKTLKLFPLKKELQNINQNIEDNDKLNIFKNVSVKKNIVPNNLDLNPGDKTNNNSKPILSNENTEIKISNYSIPKKLNILPLPMIISKKLKNSVQQNLSVNDDIKKQILENKNPDPEVQAMRREILSYLSRK